MLRVLFSLLATIHLMNSHLDKDIKINHRIYQLIQKIF